MTMRIMILLAAILALPAYATGDKHDHMVRIETRTVYVKEKDGHRDAWAVATAAGIAFWIHHRRNRRNAPPEQVRVVPAPVCEVCPTVPTCATQTARAEAACGK